MLLYIIIICAQTVAEAVCEKSRAEAVSASRRTTTGPAGLVADAAARHGQVGGGGDRRQHCNRRASRSSSAASGSDDGADVPPADARTRSVGLG